VARLPWGDHLREQVINAPSISSFATKYFKGLVGVVVLAAVATFLLPRFSGLSGGSGLPGWVLILGGIWTLVLALQSLGEPMLVMKEDGLVVRRWGSRLFHIGEGKRYPPQALNPTEIVVTGARGGRSRVVQLSLCDYSGVPHRIRFFFITLTSFQSALAQSGYE
jgi:hypothetical protein